MNIVAAFVIFALTAIVGTSESSSLVFVYWLAQVFPSISIIVRRLRDIGIGWKWMFIILVPFIGGIWFIILMCQPSGYHGLKKVSDL